MKVSVVIAIYKVGQYLRECLDSVTGQTYEDLEIICVVGETDAESVAITREYADRDARIKFVPVKPEGVAAARNRGLRESSGDCIAFVDGDDYIDNDMIETMVSAMKESGADISIVSKYYLYENTVEGIYREGNVVFDKKGVMQEILRNEKFFLHLWDKLYKREIFDGITFKEGAIVEDRQVCFALLNKAEKFVYVPQSKYYFRQALDSSSKVYKNVSDSVKEDLVICDSLRNMYPELTNDIELFLVKEYMSLLQNSFLYNVYSKEHDADTIRFIRKHMMAAMKSADASRSIKVKMLMSAFTPEQFGKLTVKRRNEFLNTHKHFKSGNDWEVIFKEQGLDV